MQKAPKAALYLRSSKDRNDVSIEAQRHELQRFAAEQGITLVAEYVDVVESGKDEDRPGFMRLYDDLRARSRLWNTVIALDTSRIARRRRIAVAFEETECARRGVRVIYKSLAGIDPESEILLKATLQGVDEWHSMVSRRKARSGMATNVRRGYRAGGRAPIGYKLLYIDTGAVREGRPVLKSRLELDPAHAGALQKYLRARANGVRRAVAVAQARVELSESSLVGIEWNALTYAGATVWNVHNMREQGAYVGGSKRRPRGEWVVQVGTHEALITTDEAERILAALAQYSQKRPRRTAGDYLLTGLLKTSGGTPWYGDQGGRYYRAGTRSMLTRVVDRTVLEKVAAELRSPAFARRIVERVRANAGREHQTEAVKLQRDADAIASRISRFMDMAANLETPGPVLRKVDELERARLQIQRDIDALQHEARIARAAKALTEGQVLELLDGFADDLARYDRDRLKDFLGRLLRHVTLDPDHASLRLHWKIAVGTRNRLASPRKRELIPPAELVSYARLCKAA